MSTFDDNTAPQLPQLSPWDQADTLKVELREIEPRTDGGGDRFLEARTRRNAPPPGFSSRLDGPTETTAVTGPPTAVRRLRSESQINVRPGQWPALRSASRSVPDGNAVTGAAEKAPRARDEDATTVRPNPLLLGPRPRPSGPGQQQRLRQRMRQHRVELAAVKAVARPKPAGPKAVRSRAAKPGRPRPELRQLLRMHRADLEPVLSRVATPNPAPELDSGALPPLPGLPAAALAAPAAPTVPRRPGPPSLPARAGLQTLVGTSLPLPSPAPQPAPEEAPPQLPLPPMQLAPTEEPAQEEPSIPIVVELPVAAEPVATLPPLISLAAPMHLPPEPAVAPPVARIPDIRHPLDFIAPATDAGPWTQRGPGQQRRLRCAPPTIRVEPLEFDDELLEPRHQRGHRRRRQAALAMLLGLLGTLAVAAAFYFVQLPGAPDHGRLEIRSVPPGATVKLNGNTVPGSTPLVLHVADLDQEYDLQLALQGHLVWRDSVTFSREDPRVSVVANLPVK